MSDSLLSAQCCVFHRNMEISSRYAWIYKLQPACFKWAAMAAIASHHVRLALFPLRLDTDRTGYVDITHSLGRRRMLLTEDVNTIRATNNAIFDDIFWVHLAYVTAEDGIERLRALLRAERHYAPILSGFEAIDQGRRVLEDATRVARRLDGRPMTSSGPATSSSSSTSSAPWCNPTSISSPARSPGSSRSARPRASRYVECGKRLRYFTSFYLYSLTRGIPHAVRAQAWPRITRFDDRWRWLVTSVVPRFRRFDADTRLVDASLRRIFDDAARLREDSVRRQPASSRWDTSVSAPRTRRAERPASGPS